MNKNDIFTVTVTDITDKGLGVGRVGDMTVFIKNAAVGDSLKIKITKLKRNYAFANIEEILHGSDDRVTPDCESFPKCGGCTLRHISYESELLLKENRVRETMRRIGKTDKMPEPIISGDPFFYRNKAQYPVNECGLGFYAAHSHRIVPCKRCMLLPDEFSSAANAFYGFLTEKNIPIYSEENKTGLVRHFYLRKGVSTGEIQAVIVINGDDLPFKDELCSLLLSVLGDALKSVVLNINKKDTNVILGDKCRTVWGNDHIYDRLCGIKIRLSPFSFYQVNHDMAEKLYKKAAEYACCENKTVLDLYCGTGTIGLSLAYKAKHIIGVEIVPQAVQDAVFNAEQNGIKNAEFFCGSAENIAKELNEKRISVDVVILDPPRKGCDKELLGTVACGFAPDRIVYVSCDVSTLARDTEILNGSGYTLKIYTPVDLFPRTSHVETVALFIKNDKNFNSAKENIL